MARENQTLSAKAIIVLEQIAEGRTYDQILARHPDLTYLDIFAAARETLTLAAEERADYAERLARIKRKYPRAYDRWTDEEDARLRDGVQRGTAVSEIAKQLQRQPSAIRSRMAKLAIDKDA